jgi:hypothetical protein
MYGGCAELQCWHVAVLVSKDAPVRRVDARYKYSLVVMSLLILCSTFAAQAVALLLPRFARHMPAALRASLLPGWVKALAADTHWNVRAEVPQLLINLLTPQTKQQQQPAAAADSGSSGGSIGGSGFALVAGYSEISKWGKIRASAAAPAAGCVADSWTTDDLRLLW